MKLSSRRGFTVIELVVAASVIGLLSVIVTANLNESRARARDVNRTESVRAYSASLEQWKASNGSYFVYLKGGTAPTCTAVPNDYMVCSGSSAVGYKGSGQGGITRKGRGADYGASSIADALLTAGFLSRIRIDPLDTDFTTKTTASSTYADFLLTLCKSDSQPADSIKNALEYGIFTKLERPEPVSQQVADAHCGGVSTPSKGWDTLQAR
ncbi:MAG TPA: type II secretion system protein [Verrucomicrobiae bacterium]|nr:type II secretion system protein [Verrucomicrobiae bacterium]